MTAPTLLIYGAYGYTGKLISQEAVAQGMSPVLAGRDAAQLTPLANALDLEMRCFALDDIDEIARQLADIDVLIHCAGPFVHTAEPMLQACLSACTHYTDVSGELAMFERAFELADAAHEAGIALCPGVGFDVIPTDCLAAVALAELPDASHLAVGVDAAPVLSPGSMKTMMQGFTRDGGMARVGGEWQRGQVKPKFREFSVGGEDKFAVSMPLADLFAIATSTGVPNVDIYQVAAPAQLQKMQKLTAHAHLLQQDEVRALVEALIEFAVEGPNEERRAELPATIIAEAKNDAGAVVSAEVSLPNGYTVTRDGAIACARLLMTFEGEGGYLTPALLGGRDLLESLPGVSDINITRG